MNHERRIPNQAVRLPDGRRLAVGLMNEQPWARHVRTSEVREADVPTFEKDPDAFIRQLKKITADISLAAVEATTPRLDE